MIARWPTRALARWLAVGGTAMVGVLALPGMAHADDPTRDDVYHALKVDDVPADYMILVDTSGSMTTNGLYGGVKATLRAFTDGLGSSDHVELYTFDENVVPCLPPAGSSPADCLPNVADGQHTDIGLAIDAALQGLERDDAADVGAIVLLTDGAHLPGPGSLYPADTASASWAALTTRAAALARRHQIEGYAINLGGTSGAAVLRGIVPSTTVLDPEIGQLSEYLDRAKAGVRLAKAKAALAVDVGQGVVASWSRKADGRPATVTLTLTSETTVTPLRVAGVRVHSPEGVTVVGDLPDVELAPGQSRSFPLSLTWSPDPGFPPFQREHSRTVSMAVQATVSSPWASAFEGAIDLRVPATPIDATADLGLTATAGTIWAQLAVGIALLVLVIVALVWRIVLTHAPQSGMIVAVDATTGYDVARFELRGRIARLQGQGLPGAAWIRARAVKPTYANLDGRVYRVRYQAEAGRKKGTLAAGGNVLLGQIAFEHVPAERPVPESLPATVR